MKKQIISLALLGTTTSLMAMFAEQAYLYKDPRIMGMGGTNIAVGAYSTSLFSNPAGLTNIKKEHGIVVDLLSVGLSATSQFTDFAEDIADAGDAENEEEAMLDVLGKYSGEHFHADVSTYMSVSKNSDLFAWSIGVLAAVDTNIMVHGKGSTNGALLETSSRGYGGVVLGVAKPYDTKIGRLDIGLGLKYISQKSIEGSLGINELINEDEDNSIEDRLSDKYEKDSAGFGVDLGLTYKPFIDNFWNPAFGLSLMNIGSMNMDDNYGQQPMTLNIGASITPEVNYIDKLVLAIDYVDLLNANKLRMYDFDEDGNVVAYTDYETGDFMKNLRLGAGVGLIDNTYFSTTLNVGLYQGAYTAGLDMQITILKINLATYQEQVGTMSNPYEDRRYMAQIGIGW